LIHYHGTPITPRAALLTMAGKHFCVSWADPRDVAVCHEIGQTVMLDNGAFTYWQQERSAPDWSGFYEWCEPWLDWPTTWAVIPDVIGGSEEENDALIEAWPFGEKGAPVWHMHESLLRLTRLVRRWPLVCVGSSGEYRTPGTASWSRRMDEAMRLICDERGRPITRLHMLRGLALRHGPFPFYSADSVDVARNHKATNGGRPAKDPRAMADRIDGVQPAPVWTPTHPQLSLMEV
jgi:hypothetical protein